MQRTQKILIVDDSEVERQVAAKLLDQPGPWRSECVESGGTAIAKLHQAATSDELPDVVLTDLDMPGMNGLELVCAMREQFPQVPVILMTAFGNEKIASDALRMGAASYVPKSQIKERLKLTVEQILARTRTERGQRFLLKHMHGIKCSFLLDSDPELIPPMVDFVQQALHGAHLTDEVGRIRMAIAFEEALLNAIYHGVLKVGPADLADIRAGRRDRISEGRNRGCGSDRNPCERRIRVMISVTENEAKLVIRDGGKGFDHKLSNRRNDECFENGNDRGLTLIRNLVDEVVYMQGGNEVTLLNRRERQGNGKMLR